MYHHSTEHSWFSVSISVTCLLWPNFTLYFIFSHSFTTTMHSKVYTSLALLPFAIPQILAAPVSNPISALVATITHDVEATLNSILSNIGVSLQNNAAAHGSTWNWRDFNFPAVPWSSKQFFHSLNWPKKVNFVDWTAYKANGVNLGAWLEQEHDYDPIWWDTYAPNAADEWTWCETLGAQCGPLMEKRYASRSSQPRILTRSLLLVSTLFEFQPLMLRGSMFQDRNCTTATSKSI